MIISALLISPPDQPPSSAIQISSDSDPQNSTTESYCPVPSTSTNQPSTNYNNYLSVVAALSDVSTDEEELNHAIFASLQSESRSTGCPPAVKDILEELASKINFKMKSKFNISRSNVLDGAIRGFKRGSYDPHYNIMVRFSDDMGFPEEAIDLGGPKREFLRLLMDALSQSSMFEGEEGKTDLALDSIAMREDRYFIAGRAIAVSLVHGGPPACFLSPTLFTRPVNGPDFAKPILEDIADGDLREKIKMIAESKTIEDIRAATIPLEEYLASAGCLRPLRRFQDGLRTLEVLDKIQAYPESFHPLLCWVPSTLNTNLLDEFFIIHRSEEGPNKWTAEDAVIPLWRDYLSDAETQGTEKLASILIFATGASRIPPLGFSPRPSVEFLHKEHGTDTTYKLPIANTCINCLKLPLHTTYNDFQENIDFALDNTHGFGFAYIVSLVYVSM
ncbi:G2/M phase-specific E3 ubiquitin-protein ligase-like isoform X2 [Alosa sapidissima]|uniref:G2/M phase-specific E3 ubiquitin-protein ligase-like isoform X2 n=1 Tax=Alosa sapidissima TaxID=34773 RepID=UPI001C07F91B|nr:G2/M phase-specific E3 ubiquitin-protein ligase-like isoform X2 [Alosa sapidissima]